MVSELKGSTAVASAPPANWSGADLAAPETEAPAALERDAPAALGRDGLSLSPRSPGLPPVSLRPAARPLATAFSRTVGVSSVPAAAQTSAPAEASKPKGFFDTLVSILKTILDLLLAPFRLLLGIFGIGSSGKASHKLSAAEKANGRPISLTAAQSPDTGAFGPYRFNRYQIKLPTRDGRVTSADLYVPEGQGPFPSLIHSYGLGGSREKHAGTASHYASWGMVVIVPTLPHGSSATAENAQEVAGWVQWVHSRPPDLPANLLLDKGVGLSGHSFGGLTSVLAADTPGVGAVVALDPADQNGIGKRAAGAIGAPSAFIMGERSLVNQFGNGNDIYAAARGDKQRLKVKGAGHTDFENSQTDGAKNAANETAMRFATGFMLYKLTGRPEYAAYARGGAEVQSEARQKLIEAD
ncbi:MAG: hypothetical protein ACAI44_22785 [Candidatus Sericytochromatia bacterium]